MNHALRIPSPEGSRTGNGAQEERLSAQPKQLGAHRSLGPNSFLLIVLLPIAAFLYLNSFAFPNTPFLQSGDQIYFWVSAQRMLDGEHIYRDFLQFTPPGTDLLYLLFIKLFGPKIWLPNLVNVALGVALCVVCFSIARQIMERWLAVPATFLFLVFTYSSVLNGTHHWFSLLAITGALAIMIRDGGTFRAAIAGSLLGVASFFTQTHGAFAVLGLLAFLVWEEANARNGWKKLAVRLGGALLGFAIALTLLNAYFVNTVGWKKLWYFQVTYAGKYVAYGQHPLFYGLLPTWHNLPVIVQFLFVYTVLPVTYAVVLIRCGRCRTGAMSGMRLPMLLCMVGLSLFLEVAASPNYLRVYAVAMPGLILLVWLVGRSGTKWRWAALLWLGIVGVAIHQTHARYHANSTIAELPAGRAAMGAQSYQKLSWLMQHTRPGQSLFQATAPTLYFPLRLHNPVFLNEITENESTRPADVQRVIQELERKEVEYIVWSPYNDYPDPSYASAYHLAPLGDYLRTRYDRVHIFPDEDELWHRKQ